METKNLADLVDFSADGPRTAPVFESDRLWSQVVCLDRTQRLGPITDQASDGLFTVVAGEVIVQMDRARKRLKQWGAVIVPAGREVTVTNASEDPAVILLVAAPPPGPQAVTG